MWSCLNFSPIHSSILSSRWDIETIVRSWHLSLNPARNPISIISFFRQWLRDFNSIKKGGKFESVPVWLPYSGLLMNDKQSLLNLLLLMQHCDVMTFSKTKWNIFRHPWKVSAAFFFLNSGIDRSVEQGQSVIAPRPKPGPPATISHQTSPWNCTVYT